MHNVVSIISESEKDYLLYQLIEGERCWLPSHIKLLKTNPQWRREIFLISREETQLSWISEEFKTPIIIDYLNEDLC